MVDNNSSKQKKRAISNPSKESSTESQTMLKESLGVVKSILDSKDQRKSIDGLAHAALELRFAARYSHDSNANKSQQAVKYALHSRDIYNRIAKMSSHLGNDGSVYLREAQQSEDYARQLQGVSQTHHLPTRRSRAILGGFLSILSLFFFSPNITGAVIGNLPAENSNLIGIILLFIGLILLVLSIKNRN